MPQDAPIGKVNGARRYGATVRLESPSLAEAMAAAHAEARDRGLSFVHPFDDLDVVAGQATLGLELLEAVPDLATVVVPLGGGGLASGVAVAVKRARPDVRIVAVQASTGAAFPASLAAGHPVDVDPRPTIADGIAVKRPGELTLPLVQRYVDAIEVVDDDEIAEAMVLLLEQSKLVVEGAGAVGVAAVLAGRVPPAGAGPTVVVLSGGNVDATVLSAVVRHHETHGRAQPRARRARGRSSRRARPPPDRARRVRRQRRRRQPRPRGRSTSESVRRPSRSWSRPATSTTRPASSVGGRSAASRRR